MSVLLSLYEVLDPQFEGTPGSQPRRIARAAYERLMDMREDRIRLLGRVLAHEGIDLDWSDTSIQSVNDWYVTSVAEAPENEGRMLPLWYSVARDVGLYLGECVLRRNPDCYWSFRISTPRDLSHHGHVIAGFSADPGVRYPPVVDFDRAVVMQGHRVIAGASVEADAFLGWVADAASGLTR